MAHLYKSCTTEDPPSHPPNTLNRVNSPPIAQYLSQLWDHTAHLTQVHQNTLVVGKCQLEQGHGKVPGSAPLTIQSNDPGGRRQPTCQMLLTAGCRVQHSDLEVARAEKIARSVSLAWSRPAGGWTTGFGQGPPNRPWGSPSPPPSQAKYNNANWMHGGSEITTVVAQSSKILIHTHNIILASRPYK